LGENGSLISPKIDGQTTSNPGIIWKFIIFVNIERKGTVLFWNICSG
jgi:hypothetical protein